MRYLYVLLGCMLVVGISEAQIYIKPRLIGAPVTGCTNTIAVEVTGLTPESRIGTTFGDNDVSNGDTLTDFCVDSLPVYSAQLYLAAHFFDNYDVPLAESPAIPQVYNFEITDFIEPTDLSTADGSFIVAFDSILDTAYVHAQSLGWGFPVLTWLDGTHMLVEGAAFGPNYLYLGDMNPDLWESMYNILFYLGDPEELQKPHMYAYVSASVATDGCQGTAEVISYYTEGTVTYDWGIPGEPNVPYIDSLCPGVYTVIVSDSSLDTMYISFTVYEVNLSAEAVVTDADTICNGSVEIVTYNADGEVHYAWSTPGSPDEPMLDSICPGDYFVRVTDASGDTTYVTFTVGGQAWKLFSDDAYQQSAEQGFRIYPNPASDYLHVITAGEAVIELYDAYGKLVRSSRGAQTYIADLADGVYLVRVNGHDKLQRLVKTH